MNELDSPIPLDDLVKIYKPDAEPESGATAARLERPEEIGGPKGPEPTRYGDWEKKGRCIDF